MKLVQVVLVLVVGVDACLADSYDALTYADRECGTNLATLWLDVVAVVDNSIGMTNDGLASIAANIASVFSSGTIIGIDPNEPRTTRLGLVTYNAVAQQNADLNKFKSLEDIYDNVFVDLNGTSKTAQSVLARGLDEAEIIFSKDSVGPPRGHYKKVVIVYASSFSGTGSSDPVEAAYRMKTNGITIITVGFLQSDDDSVLRGLEKVASPGYNFTNTDYDGNLLGKIQEAMLETNCFCPNNWIQYQVDASNPYSFKYGVCIHPVGLAATWRAAKMACANYWKNSFLVTEFNQQKHDFILDSVKNNMTGFSAPFTYHIGLNMKNGQWIWDQPAGFEQPVLQPGGWTNWVEGYPLQSSTMMVVLNMQNNQEVITQWQNTNQYTTAANYICETSSCDTNNYCSSDGTDY